METEYLGLGVLLLLSGVFSGTETAFTSLSLMQIHSLQTKYGKRGEIAQRLLERPDRLLTTVLIGNNLVNIAASAIASAITIRLFGNAALGAMTGVLTLFILIFGEVTPKQIAIVHNEYIACVSAPAIFALSIALRPVVWIVGSASFVVTRLSGPSDGNTPTREGILHVIGHASTLGVIENYKYHMVKNVFRFSDVTVQAVMSHRTRVFSLNQSLTIDQALPEIVGAGYSRIPVYADNPEEIVGIVLLKDVLDLTVAGDRSTRLKRIMVDPIYVPENRRIHRMLQQFRKSGLNIAIVRDEYGGLAGIVTLEDVIEEILGEIYDEHEEQEREKIVKLPDGNYLLAADLPLYLANDKLGTQFETGGSAQTIGGYLTEYTGRIPQKDDTISTAHGEFVVLSMQKKRIVSVQFHPATQD